ncbi:MAG: arginine--tRNA ligase [Aeriscardovia sp.]|nr:arginine--tRNA ligase [Aeriscardovia sp.]
MSPEALGEKIHDICVKLAQEGKLGRLEEGQVPSADKIAVKRPKNSAFGTWATPIAMQLASKAQIPALEAAETIAGELRNLPGVENAVAAGKGFINVTLSPDSATEVVDKILDEKGEFGRNSHLKGTTINLEYVSANPTGPIHIGGARWAAIGDSLSRILSANGAKVVREYYFNDHGKQIDRFANSLMAWANGEPTPEDGYKGAYIGEIAGKVIDQAKEEGIDILSLPKTEGEGGQLEEFRKRAVPMMFDEIKDSLHNFGSDFDVWFHEQSLHDSGSTQKAIEVLRDKGDIYEKDGATWFASTKYGDDKDRVIIKSDGNLTYFAPDLAYYFDKRHRAKDPADVAIYMLGADHSGYIGRLMAVCAAYGDEPQKAAQVLLGQMVTVSSDGKPIRMSKRAGTVVTLEDLVDAIGVDAARYALERSSYNQSIDIDLALLSSHSNDNPIYYVQYAHARCCSIENMAKKMGMDASKADLSLLDTPLDERLLSMLALYPSVVKAAGDLREPHRIAHYLEDLASCFHTWYGVERVIPGHFEEGGKGSQIEKAPSMERADARLKLTEAVKQVIENGLGLLGVSAPEVM